MSKWHACVSKLRQVGAGFIPTPVTFVQLNSGAMYGISLPGLNLTSDVKVLQMVRVKG